MAKFLELVNGVPTVVNPAIAGGSANANKIPQLDANGQLTANMMPNGIGADTISAVASEAISAGDFVNVYSNAGTATVRKADATSSARYANGYVTEAVTNGGTATVYSDDKNDQVTGATVGDAFLSVQTPGKTQATAPVAAGQISQKVGVASAATVIKVKIDQHYILA